MQSIRQMIDDVVKLAREFEAEFKSVKGQFSTFPEIQVIEQDLNNIFRLSEAEREKLFENAINIRNSVPLADRARSPKYDSFYKIFLQIINGNKYSAGRIHECCVSLYRKTKDQIFVKLRDLIRKIYHKMNEEYKEILRVESLEKYVTNIWLGKAA